MKKHTKAFGIWLLLIPLFLTFCSQGEKESLVNAELKAFTDTATGTEKQYEGLQAGGEKQVEAKQVKYENASCLWDSAAGELSVSFTDTLSWIEATPTALSLPKDWVKYKLLRVKLSNPNDFPVRATVQVRGTRNMLPTDFELKGGQSAAEDISLYDLPLTARIENVHQPNAIRVVCRSEKTPAKLLLSQISLVKTQDTVAQPVVDQFGQRIRTEWDSKVHSIEEFNDARDKERQTLDTMQPPPQRDKFGGWTGGKTFEATGFFRVEQDGERWWLVTPEGTPFWSHGVTCVRSKYINSDVTTVKGREFLFDTLPPKDGDMASAYMEEDYFSFYSWNLLRKYGSREKWRDAVYERLQKWGLNSIGNWSELSVLQNSPIPFTHSYRTSRNEKLVIGKGFSDVFNPEWAAYIDEVISDAQNFKDNPLLIGYFIDNEAGWGNMQLLKIYPPNTPGREKWLSIVRKKYGSIEKLNSAYGKNFASWDEVKNMTPQGLSENQAFLTDKLAFESAFAEKYFSQIHQTLKKHDPNHLYLGCRFTKRVKPAHVVAAAGKYCDVVTVNCYSLVPERWRMEKWYQLAGRPILIGEHHLPLASQRQLPPKYRAFTPAERLKYYQEYIKTWASMPFSVGAHWYQFADQHITGRATDGENQTVGLVDITDQPHQHIVDAVRKAAPNVYKWHSESK